MQPLAVSSVWVLQWIRVKMAGGGGKMDSLDLSNYFLSHFLLSDTHMNKAAFSVHHLFQTSWDTWRWCWTGPLVGRSTAAPDGQSTSDTGVAHVWELLKGLLWWVRRTCWEKASRHTMADRGTPNCTWSLQCYSFFFKLLRRKKDPDRMCLCFLSYWWMSHHSSHFPRLKGAHNDNPNNVNQGMEQQCIISSLLPWCPCC